VIVAVNLSPDGAQVVERAVLTVCKLLDSGSGAVSGRGLPNVDLSRPKSETAVTSEQQMLEALAEYRIEVDRLATLLEKANAEVVEVSSRTFLDADHRRRLEVLIEQQHSEISRLNETIDQVRALRDFAEWTGRATVGNRPEGSVRTTDLTRALETARGQDSQ
jgi:hypothetical protein